MAGDQLAVWQAGAEYSCLSGRVAVDDVAADASRRMANELSLSFNIHPARERAVGNHIDSRVILDVLVATLTPAALHASAPVGSPRLFRPCPHLGLAPHNRPADLCVSAMARTVRLSVAPCVASQGATENHPVGAVVSAAAMYFPVIASTNVMNLHVVGVGDPPAGPAGTHVASGHVNT